LFIYGAGLTTEMNLDFIQHRSYKNLDMEEFIDDVRSIDFENLVSVENVDEAYSNFQSAFIEVIYKHMPLKKRKPVVNPAPYMNKELRQAIYKKRMYHNKFIKFTRQKWLYCWIKRCCFGTTCSSLIKYVFIESLFIFVTRFLCFLYISQFLSDLYLGIVSKCDSFFSNEVSFIWLRTPTHPLQMKV
jgi:hypothetical protein